MVKIRLARGGKKNDPFYRIVATEHRNKLTGKALAVLGHWHPASDLLEVDKKGIKEWVKNGAQVSEAVEKLMKK